MNPLLLPTEVLVSLAAILIVAAVGSVAALKSWARISEGKRVVKRAESSLVGDAAWEEAYPRDKLNLAVWLRDKGINPDSHLGDLIRTCWSAWLGGRPASLTELHALVARRERSHSSSRLSAGIAALLLVFGIVGTLSSIKPVLHNFKFQVAEDVKTKEGRERSEDAEIGRDAALRNEPVIEDASVAANTELVNSLIHNLGNAFWPSLLALCGTIAVVTCRGLYSLSLNRFTLELDRFAVDTLIPRYRVPSLSEQYLEVRDSLAGVTEGLLKREGRFHQAVEALEKLVEGITPALSGLSAAASASKNAAEDLSSRANSISDGLTRHLGAKSPIYRAIRDFEDIFKKTGESVMGLSTAVAEIGESNAANRQDLEAAIKGLVLSVDRIAASHQAQQTEAKAVVHEFRGSLAGIPAAILTTSENAVDASIATVRSAIALLGDEQKKWHAASAEDLRAATSTGFVSVTKAGQELANQAGKIAAAATDYETIKKGVSSAIQDLATAGRLQIGQVGEITKARVEAVADKLANDAEKITYAVERLSAQMPPPTTDVGSKRGDSNHGIRGKESAATQRRFEPQIRHKPSIEVESQLHSKDAPVSNPVQIHINSLESSQIGAPYQAGSYTAPRKPPQWIPEIEADGDSEIDGDGNLGSATASRFSQWLSRFKSFGRRKK